MALVGFFSGSFDPITLGHIDVIDRALAVVKELVVGIGVNNEKMPMFTAAERIEMIENDCLDLAAKHGTAFRTVIFNNLAVKAAYEQGAGLIIRGLRHGTDFDYEMQMASMNAEMAPSIQTIFLASSPEFRHIASNLVRQIAKMEGNVSHFVSNNVALRLKDKIK
ncbi:MAG: Phosphopantetheine adenylyltransferase [Hyphomicrobiaceae bacterium hypho_1]